MKNLSLVMTLLIFCVSQQLFAQKSQSRLSKSSEKIITADEFNEITYKAQTKLEAGNYRTKTVEEVFSGTNTVPIETRTEISESAPAADKTRIVKEIKNARGAASKTGFMLLGKERYDMNAKGEWVLNPRAGWGSGIGSGGGASTDTRIYKFIGKSVFAGQPILIYEVSGKHQSYFEEQFVENNETTRYWFSPDGKLLREEGTNDYAALGLRVKTLVINEYNAKVNILKP